jgi:hypothetical protein
MHERAGLRSTPCNGRLQMIDDAEQRMEDVALIALDHLPALTSPAITQYLRYHDSRSQVLNPLPTDPRCDKHKDQGNTRLILHPAPQGKQRSGMCRVTTGHRNKVYQGPNLRELPTRYQGARTLQPDYPSLEVPPADTL